MGMGPVVDHRLQLYFLMNLPEPLPETDDFRLKGLFSWCNRLRDYAQSITLMRSADSRLERTPAGTLLRPARDSTPRDLGIRSVTNWYLPPITITETDRDGFSNPRQFTWNGLIAFGPWVGGAAANEENIYGTGGYGSDTLFAFDYGVSGFVDGENTSPPSNFVWDIDPVVWPGFADFQDAADNAAFYLVDLPPTLRNQIVGGTFTQQDQRETGLTEWLFDYAYANGQPTLPQIYDRYPFDSTNGTYYGDGVGNGTGSGAATDDYTAYIEPSYFPGSTLYIANPNRLRTSRRYFYQDAYFGATIELNMGWVDLNVDARRWMAAGLVENHMRVQIATNGSGVMIPPPNASVGLDGNLYVPVNQDSNYYPANTI